MKLNTLPVLAAVSLLLLCSSSLHSVAAGKKPPLNLQPLPADFPALSSERTPAENSEVTEFVEIRITNRELLHRLSNYTPDSVAKEFERRMEKEKDSIFKLVLAEIAAENGSAWARDFIEKLASKTDFKTTMCRLDALSRLLQSHHPQGWVFDAVHSALTDMREVTNVPPSSPVSDRIIADIADWETGLTFVLGECKHQDSVPLLIELARRKEGGGFALGALGKIGDPRGIPVCLELLDRHADALKNAMPGLSSPPQQLLSALADLHAQAAVPTLLKYVDNATVIDALGRLGDERAIEPLKQIVARSGHVEGESDARGILAQERLFTARAALIRLEKEDPFPKWIALLKDPSLTEFQRSGVVYEFYFQPDPRAIEPLFELIQSDPKPNRHGWIGRAAISALSKYPYKRVVTGLIECFDAPFSRSSIARYESMLGNPLDQIGSALHTLTGEDFGRDKARWKKWWDDEGKDLPGLQ